jgi:GNAT superfamily N-acetyltransferase
LERALLGGKHRFLVAQERSGGRIIGCCGIGRHAIPNDHIFDLIFWFVQPEFQRKGLGTLLLAGVLLWLRKAHANSSLPILHFEALFPTQKYFQAVEALWSEELPGYEGFSRRQGRISLAYSVSRRLSEFLIGNKFQIPMPQAVLPRFADQHR